MTKRLTIFLCALMLCPLGLAAQNQDEIPYRHEWRFGIAGYPLLESLLYSDGIGAYEMIDPAFYYLNADRLYRDFEGTRRMAGLFSAEYSINYRKRFTFAVGAYLSTAWNKVYGYDGTAKSPNFGMGLTIMPTARFKYVRREAFNMYGSVGLGLIAGFFDDEAVACPTFQLVPVGFTFGRKVYGFAELGIGTLYIGGNIGVGYRF